MADALNFTRSPPMNPSKRLFESEEHFRAQAASPAKRLFESEKHFRERVADMGHESATAHTIWDRTRCITEHDGRVAARCNDYPGQVGYGADEHEAKLDLLRAIHDSGGSA